MIEALNNLVDALANNFMALMPFVIVKQWQRGCRWTLGKNPKELLPGLHWRCYIIHEVEVGGVVDDVMMLPIQSVITADHKLVCFRASFGYRVVDVVRHLNNVMDFQTSTISLAQQHLAKRVRALTLPDLENDLSKLENSLQATLTTKFKDWGTEVFSVGFVDFAEVPTQVRLFQDTVRII